MLPDRDGCWESWLSSPVGTTCLGGWRPEMIHWDITVTDNISTSNLFVYISILPLKECTLGSLCCVWPWDCLDRPVITPESSLLALCSAFKLQPGTESGSMDSVGVAAALLDWRKIIIPQIRCVYLYMNENDRKLNLEHRSPSWCKGLPYGSVGLSQPLWQDPFVSTHWEVQLVNSPRLLSIQLFPAAVGELAHGWPGLCGFQSQTHKAHRMRLTQRRWMD